MNPGISQGDRFGAPRPPKNEPFGAQVMSGIQARFVRASVERKGRRVRLTGHVELRFFIKGGVGCAY